MAFINDEHVLGRTDFCLGMRVCILGRWLRGVRRPAFLPTKSDATVGRLHNHRTIVRRKTANRRLNYFSRALANSDHQIRRLSVHHRSEPAPFHKRFLYIFLSRFVSKWRRQRSARVRVDQYHNCAGFKNICR